MWRQIGTFLRLVWAEWSSRVTGPLSAILVLAGLGISVASTFGVKIPSEPIIQLGTWLLAAICGGQAAYSVWAREHNHVIALQSRLTPKYSVSFHEENGSPVRFTDGHPALYFRLCVDNKSTVPVVSCEGWATEIYKNEKLSPMSAVKLTWVGGGTSVTLRPHIPRLLDICFIRDDNEGVLCTENLTWPVDQASFFSLSNIYKFKILVSAENTATLEPMVLEWTLGKKWNEAKMRVI